VDAGELIEHCRAHIASFKKPTRIEFVDALPRNAYGKVLRRELRERFAVDATSGSDPVVAS
jgi:fatty-acyl-CoA synthase